MQDLYTYFRILAILKNAKKFSGHREAIYRLAADFGGMYDFRLPQRSIWHEIGSDDLQVSLLFHSNREANHFIAALSEIKTRNQKKITVEFNE